MLGFCLGSRVNVENNPQKAVFSDAASRKVTTARAWSRLRAFATSAPAGCARTGWGVRVLFRSRVNVENNPQKAVFSDAASRKVTTARAWSRLRALATSVPASCARAGQMGWIPV